MIISHHNSSVDDILTLIVAVIYNVSNTNPLYTSAHQATNLTRSLIFIILVLSPLGIDRYHLINHLELTYIN